MELELNGRKSKLNPAEQRIMHLLAGTDSLAFADIVRDLSGEFSRQALEEGVLKLRSSGFVNINWARAPL